MVTTQATFSTFSVFQKRRKGCFDFVVVPRRILHLSDARLDCRNDFPELPEIRERARSDLTESHFGKLTKPRFSRKSLITLERLQQFYVQNKSINLIRDG